MTHTFRFSIEPMPFKSVLYYFIDSWGVYSASASVDMMTLGQKTDLNPILN